VESDFIVEYINYINQAYCSYVQCFINGGEAGRVDMVFDAKGQVKEGVECKFCGNVILYCKDRMLFHLGYQYDGNGQTRIIMCSTHPQVKTLFA
jgi:hypothetical protein